MERDLNKNQKIFMKPKEWWLMIAAKKTYNSIKISLVERREGLQWKARIVAFKV